MSTMVDFITDPWTFEFMRRAFAVAMVSGAVCGVVGTFVVLRGMSFIGDAIIHSVFPGVAIGFALKFNLAISGAIAGIITAIGITALAQNRRLKEDAVIGVLFALAFGIGIVVISTQNAYTGDLASFLFGQVLGISDSDVITVLILGAAIVVMTLLIKKQLVTVSLDRETAKVMGLPVFWLDVALYVLVTLAVVMSLQAVGNILVLALLIVPRIDSTTSHRSSQPDDGLCSRNRCIVIAGRPVHLVPPGSFIWRPDRDCDVRPVFPQLVVCAEARCPGWIQVSISTRPAKPRVLECWINLPFNFPSILRSHSGSADLLMVTR